MGSFSPIHLLVLAVVAILLLGGGRFSSLMGDVAKGVKNFKKGMAEEDDDKRKDRGRDRIPNKKDAATAFHRSGARLHDRKSVVSGKSVEIRVVLWGRIIIKKKTKHTRIKLREN